MVRLERVVIADAFESREHLSSSYRTRHSYQKDRARDYCDSGQKETCRPSTTYNHIMTSVVKDSTVDTDEWQDDNTYIHTRSVRQVDVGEDFDWEAYRYV